MLLHCWLLLSFVHLTHIAHARFYFIDDELRDSSWAWPKSPVLTHYHFGVQHLLVPGVLQVNNQPTTVLLLTYLKASLASNNTVIWHGRVIAYDPTRLTLHLDRFTHHENPHDIRAGAHPTFALQRASMGVQHARTGDADTYPLELVQSHMSPDAPLDAGKSWLLRGQTPLSDPLEFYFCADDWAYTALITQDVMDLPPYIEPHVGPYNVHAIVKPLYGKDPDKALRQVSLFVDNYAQLGFNSSILYERGTYMRHLHTHAATAKQMHDGALKLMLWDHGSALAPLATRESLPPDDPHFPQYDELNVYEHALTIMYGMNAYILIADIDEYMILPQPLTLPSIHNALMQGCLATGAPAHRVSRFAFPQCPPAQPEVFVACASEQMKQGKGTLVKFESGDPLPKTLYFVDDIYSAAVHKARSFVFPSDTLGHEVPETCAYIIHANDVNWNSA